MQQTTTVPTMITPDIRAAELANLQAEHAKQLAKLQAEHDAVAALPLTPGATLRMVHGKLYGVRHIAMHVQDLTALLDYMSDNALPVFAFRGIYAGMYPERPATRDYDDVQVLAEGVAVVTVQRSVKYARPDSEVVFFTRDLNDNIVKLSFTVGGYRYSGDTHASTRLDNTLAPIPIYRTDIHNHSRTDRPLEGYRKTGAGKHQFIFHDVDKQGATLNTLCTMEQIYNLWKAE